MSSAISSYSLGSSGAFREALSPLCAKDTTCPGLFSQKLGYSPLF
jgi:hypothetical protein